MLYTKEEFECIQDKVNSFNCFLILDLGRLLVLSLLMVIKDST